MSVPKDDSIARQEQDFEPRIRDYMRFRDYFYIGGIIAFCVLNFFLAGLGITFILGWF